MKTYKKFLTIVVAIAIFSGCQDKSSTQQESQATEKSMQQIGKAQPIYLVDASQARANLSAAELAMAEGANTWTAVFQRGGTLDHPIFEYSSAGFPIPFASNLTNPLRATGGQGAVIGQAEPTLGFFTPATADMTYGNCVLPNGKIGNFTSESDITAFAFDVEWDSTKHMYVMPPDGNGSVYRKVGTTVSVDRLTPGQVNARIATPDEIAKLNNG